MIRLPTVPPFLAAHWQHGRTWWQQRPLREQQLMLTAALLLLVCVLWYGLLAPALHTWRTFHTQYNAQQAQWQSMLQLQAQARSLQANPPAPVPNPVQLLQTLTHHQLGASANLSPQGNTLVLTLAGTPANQLGAWLQQAREQVHALPQEAQLQHGPHGWEGRIVLTLQGGQ